MLPSRSGFLVEAINTMEMQWAAYDQVVWGSTDDVVIRKAVISRHIKVKNFRRTSTGPKQDSATRHRHPIAIKALHTRKIIKLGFLSLPCYFFKKIHNIRVEKQNCFLPSWETISDRWNLKRMCLTLCSWNTAITVYQNIIYLTSHSCSVTLMTFYFPEARQHNIVLKFHTHYVE